MLKEEMIKLARHSFPDLKIKEIQFKNNGWDNDILIINKQIVFRFPKNNKLLVQINDEIKILQQLALKKPLLQVPRYSAVYEKNIFRAVTYSFLMGESLDESLLTNLSSNPDNAMLIGDFLTKLHSINLSVFKGTKLHTIHKLSYWEMLYSSVKNKVFPLLNRDQQNEINEVFVTFLKRCSTLTYKKVLIHGDLSASNMVFDKNNNRISGVIDFTDAQIGDPAFDFAGLYWNFGPKFMKKVLSFYASNESKDYIFKRVSTFYGLQPVFHELLYAVKNNQSFDSRMLQRFSELRNMVND